MNMLASGFANFINGIFANWQMLLFGIGAVLLLLTLVFRKFKLTAIILSLVAAGIGVVLLIDLIAEAVTWKLPDLAAFLVKWVPTVLFTATVLIATLIGVKRGLRKSLILLAHEVGLAALCITAYAVLVNLPAVDGFTLKLVNFFMGGSGSLQRSLGVTAQCSGIKEVFVEWLPTVLSGDINIMLSESKAYIFTLADLIYHVAFALVLFILYLLLDFIMYIIYLCCYSERKYKKKIEQKYSENKVDRRYSKHHVGGGVVGLVRGLAIGLISLSFLGTALYIVAGRGEGKLKDFDFGDSNVNEYYSVYRSIESYGTSGIFKVLNSISSTDDVPYYLFAADLVFSGGLDDGETEISGNVVFREELSAYTDFARDTMSLLLKYGGDEIRPLIKGEATGNAFDTVLDVMSDDMFRAEFNDLISEFDAKTYIINFAMSFVNSAIANIDDMSFAGAVSEDNRELLKILFTKGYLSETIPDERLIKNSTQGTGVQFIQPYINVSKLVDKKDIQIIFNVVLDVLGKKTSTTEDVLNLVGDVLPEVKKISLLNENRAKELDPVLGRLYCYAANRYLTAEGSDGVWYTDIYAEHIEWVSELNSLVNVAEASVNLYNNISSSSKPMDMLVSLFDKGNPSYNENIAYYDSISKSILSSRIVGKTLATSRIYKLICEGLGNLFEGIYIPEDTVYESTFDENGNLVTAGEMFNVFNGLGVIGKTGDLLPMLEDFNKDRDMEAFLNSLSKSVGEKDGYGYTVGEYIINSNLLRSVISAAFINYGAEYAYVPASARETDADGEIVKFIKKDELAVLFDNLSALVDFILPVLQDENADMKQAIADFMKKDAFNVLVSDSKIFEGTVGLHLVNTFENDENVIIPASLKTELDGWVSETGRAGELRNLLTALDISAIEIDEIISDDFDTDSVVKRIGELTHEELDKCLKSGVLHYTISKYLDDEDSSFGSFKLIVPAAAAQKLENDSIPALVKKSEIEYVLQFAKNFDMTAETGPDMTSVVVKLVENRDLLLKSFILSASVVRSLADNAEVNKMLKLPEEYEQAAQTDKLKKFNSSNPWKDEVYRLITALDEIMCVSTDENFTFSEDKLTESLSEFLKNMSVPSRINANVSRLTVCYASEVVRGNITSRLDEILEGNIDRNLLYGAKSGGYYSEKELKSLSEVLVIFDIDIMNMKSDELNRKIKDEALTLNDPAEGHNGSKLNAVYPSVIFSGMLSKELDDVLLNGTDEDGNPAPMIDRNVLYQIKGGTSRYGEGLIAGLISSVNGFGIENFDRINDLGIDSVKEKIDNIDVICSSLIMRGVFTKQISENNTLGVDHPLAYEQDIKIIKSGEIKSIVNLINKLDDVEEKYFDTVSLKDIKENLFNENRSVKSYLILSAVSDSIKNNGNLIVNKKLVDEYGCIDKDEVFALCNAFMAMYPDNACVDSLDSGGFSYPTAQQRLQAVESEIVRAKLTEQLLNENRGENFIGVGRIEQFTALNGETYGVIIKHEMNAICNVIDRCKGEGDEDFKIPTININTLSAYYSDGGQDIIYLMFETDLIRFKVCDCIMSRFGTAGYDVTEEDAYLLTGLLPVTKNTISEINVINALDMYLG
ncbi:MAG: hypothetical protein NC131_00710 [Roseburia sp.]|nr:hypothetical protein [Roseburia sp.]